MLLPKYNQNKDVQTNAQYNRGCPCQSKSKQGMPIPMYNIIEDALAKVQSKPWMLITVYSTIEDAPAKVQSNKGCPYQRAIQ
jgi:hypothetical protein